MQDRFKFRSFGRPNSIIEGMQNIYTFEETENGYANVKVEKGWLAFVEKENLKIMQCTGLKDKNGKLIYEGDICEYNFEDIGKQRAIIIFNNKLAGFIAKPITNFQYTELNNCEIIGNIYEYPELLKDGEQT